MSTSTIDEGELCLVVGRTGSGKSTLLGAINGLVPHFTGGHLAGRVVGRRPRHARRTARASSPTSSAVVGQDPLAGFVTDTVEEELAYGMEQLGRAGRRRCASGSRRRSTCSASPTCAARPLRDALRRAAAARRHRRRCSPRSPRVLVLDEPTSALDPTAAEEVLADASPASCTTSASPSSSPSTGSSGWCSTPTASCTCSATARSRSGLPAGRSWRRPTIAPPVVELGRLAGWSPLPLSVRDARRAAAPAARRARDPASRKPDRRSRWRPAGVLLRRATSSCATATSSPCAGRPRPARRARSPP